VIRHLIDEFENLVKDVLPDHFELLVGLQLWRKSLGIIVFQ